VVSAFWFPFMLPITLASRVTRNVSSQPKAASVI